MVSDEAANFLLERGQQLYAENKRLRAGLSNLLAASDIGPQADNDEWRRLYDAQAEARNCLTNEQSPRKT